VAKYPLGNGFDLWRHRVVRERQMTFEEAARALQDSADRNAQAQAGGVLLDWADRDRPGVLRVLTEAIQHTDWRARSNAVLLFGDLGEGYDLLVNRLQQDPVAHVRALCAGMLSLSDYRPAIQAFIAALQDEDPKVVYAACRLLGRAGSDEAVGPLHQELEHWSWYVRFCDCEALYRLGAVGQQVVAILEALDGDPEATTHNERVSRFRRNRPAARGSTTVELLDLVRQALKEDEDDDDPRSNGR
jgi:HEAT repeat protein